ncbi:hypothetical protein TIFTF001_035950 [Ficus carica]|uniref:Uncharacterized protein n=1 Tax=Ficus carica TaxID=3494 RepID=A0AA88E3C7_FICCA|nr:hypothetical protein TIFTF001_035950 [Ficus carica]
MATRHGKPPTSNVCYKTSGDGTTDCLTQAPIATNTSLLRGCRRYRNPSAPTLSKTRVHRAFSSVYELA